MGPPIYMCYAPENNKEVFDLRVLGFAYYIIFDSVFRKEVFDLGVLASPVIIFLFRFLERKYLIWECLAEAAQDKSLFRTIQLKNLEQIAILNKINCYFK